MPPSEIIVVPKEASDAKVFTDHQYRFVMVQVSISQDLSATLKGARCAVEKKATKRSIYRRKINANEDLCFNAKRIRFSPEGKMRGKTEASNLSLVFGKTYPPAGAVLDQKGAPSLRVAL